MKCTTFHEDLSAQQMQSSKVKTENILKGKSKKLCRPYIVVGYYHAHLKWNYVSLLRVVGKYVSSWRWFFKKLNTLFWEKGNKPVLIVCHDGKDSEGNTEVMYSVWTPWLINLENPGYSGFLKTFFPFSFTVWRFSLCR